MPVRGTLILSRRLCEVGWPVPFLAAFNFPSVATRYPFAAGRTVSEHPNYDPRVRLEPSMFRTAVKRSNHLANRPRNIEGTFCLILILYLYAWNRTGLLSSNGRCNSRNSLILLTKTPYLPISHYRCTNLSLTSKSYYGFCRATSLLLFLSQIPILSSNDCNSTQASLETLRISYVHYPLGRSFHICIMIGNILIIQQTLYISNFLRKFFFDVTFIIP